MYDVITIGAATVDIFLKSPQFHLQPTDDEGLLLCQKYGDKIDIDDCLVVSGGAGTNCAVGFARLGFKTAAVVEVGRDLFAQQIYDDLKRDQVDTRFVIGEKGENTAISVLLISAKGGRTALTHRGAASQLEARDLPWAAIKESRWVHLSNVGGDFELLLRLFDHLQHCLTGLSWNPGKKELELLAKRSILSSSIPCEIFLVNTDEWQILTPVQAELKKNFPTVIVTDGRKGGVVYNQGKTTKYSGKIVPVVQETGAGDAFAVGVVAGHLSGMGLDVSVEWGKRNAASVIGQMGAKAGLLNKSQLLIWR